jgi:hypothetical protein
MRLAFRRIICFVLALFLSEALVLGGGESSKASVNKFNCIINIETETVDDYMTFEGSQLVPIIKATISYRMADGGGPPDNAPSVKYEELWYRAGDPLGCVRYRQLGSRELALTQIRIVSKSSRPSQAEIAAQANALVRIYLDAYLRIALLTSVLVPDSLFGSLVTALAKENFVSGQVVYGSGVDPSILLPLEGESGKVSTSLHYNTVR